MSGKITLILLMLTITFAFIFVSCEGANGDRIKNITSGDGMVSWYFDKSRKKFKHFNINFHFFKRYILYRL